MTYSFRVVTVIGASATESFAASLSTALHADSMATYKEVARSDAAVLGLGDEVEFEARHFGFRWRMRSRITELVQGRAFTDEQVRGPFRSFHHYHRFQPDDNGCIMTDDVRFSAPLGPLGVLVERIVLGRYLRRIITERSSYLKTLLEGKS